MQSKGSGTFSKILKQLRKNRDWSQEQLAQIICIDTQRISKTLEVSLDYLMTGKSHDAEKVKNIKLIERIEKIEKLPIEYQDTLISVLDSFINRHKFE